MIEADQNNVVFVNFHKYEIGDFEIEQFGKRELFHKINEFFTNSKDYKEKKEKFEKNKLEEELKSLRTKAEQILFTNKFWGAAVGLIPFLDMVVQHFYIKKNAIKKVGDLYGISIDLIEEKKEKEKTKSQKNDSSFYTPDIGTEYLTTSVDGDELIEQTLTENVNDYYNGFGKAGCYIGAETNIGIGVVNASKYIQVQAKAIELAAKADKAREAYNAANAINNTVQNVGLFGKAWNYISGAGEAASMGVQQAANALQQASTEASIAAEELAATSSGTFWKVAGSGLGIIGVVAGVALGGYFTHKFCEELLDKFEEYFRKNGEKISNSYEDAAKYFLIDN